MQVKRFPRASADRAEDTPRATRSHPAGGRRSDGLSRIWSEKTRRYEPGAEIHSRCTGRDAGPPIRRPIPGQSLKRPNGRGAGPIHRIRTRRAMAEIVILQGDDQNHHSTGYCIREEAIRRLGLGENLVRDDSDLPPADRRRLFWIAWQSQRQCGEPGPGTGNSRRTHRDQEV